MTTLGIVLIVIVIILLLELRSYIRILDKEKRRAVREIEELLQLYHR